MPPAEPGLPWRRIEKGVRRVTATTADHTERELLIMLGSPRSGTTWLQTMLGAHPEICTAGEMKLFHMFTSRWEEAWDTIESFVGADSGVRRFMSREDIDRHARSLIETLYTRVESECESARVLLDKTPQYALNIGHIDRLYPKSRFIHVLRDGRDVAVSMIAASRGWGSGWAAGDVRSAARRWLDYTRGGLEGRALGESRYLEIRYEDALSDPAAVLARCCEFADLEYDRRWLEDTVEEHTFSNMRKHRRVAGGGQMPRDFFKSGRSGTWVEGLSGEERLEFDEVAGDLLVELGYASPDWWVTDPGDRWLLPLRIRSRNVKSAARKLVKALVK